MLCNLRDTAIDEGFGHCPTGFLSIPKVFKKSPKSNRGALRSLINQIGQGISSCPKYDLGHSFLGCQTKRVHLGQDNHESFSNLQAHLSTVCDSQNHLSPWVERCLEGVLCLGESFLTIKHLHFSIKNTSAKKGGLQNPTPKAWFKIYLQVFGAQIQQLPTVPLRYSSNPGAQTHLLRSSLDFMMNTTWAPATYERSCNPYKWPHKWVTGVITPIFGVITLLIYGANPSQYVCCCCLFCCRVHIKHFTCWEERWDITHISININYINEHKS